MVRGGNGGFEHAVGFIDPFEMFLGFLVSTIGVRVVTFDQLLITGFKPRQGKW